MQAPFSMLRLSKLTDYALLLLAEMAAGEGLRSASELAEQTGLEATTVAKVLKQLGQCGLVSSVRGAHGGYQLSRPASRISVGEVVSAMEGPIGMTECAIEHGLCNHESRCGMRSNWMVISRAVARALNDVSVADMMKPLDKTWALPINM